MFTRLGPCVRGAFWALAVSSFSFSTAAAQPNPAVRSGAVASQEPLSQQDVIYGRVKGAALLADIAYPQGTGPFPAILSVHGGRWVGGHRADKSAIQPK